MAAPVVEHVRQVDDARAALGHPQGQIVVLAAVVLRAQAADRLDQGAAHHEEVPEVHPRGERVRAPLGLEVGIEQPARVVDLVLVAVEHVAVAGRGAQRDHRQGVGREQVVVVEEGHELAARQRERGVAGRRDAARPRAAHHPHAWVARVLLQQRRDVGGARAVVGDAQLPVRVDLRQHRVERGPQVRRAGIVDRHDHADPRQARGARERGAQQGQIARAGRVLGQPPVVGVVDRGAQREHAELERRQRPGRVDSQPALEREPGVAQLPELAGLDERQPFAHRSRKRTHVRRRSFARHGSRGSPFREPALGARRRGEGDPQGGTLPTVCRLPTTFPMPPCARRPARPAVRPAAERARATRCARSWRAPGPSWSACASRAARCTGTRWSTRSGSGTPARR